MTFFGQRRVGELNSRISADLTQIEATLIMSVPQFLRQILLLVGGITLITATSGRLTLIMLSAIPPAIILAVVFGRKLRKNSRDTQDKLAETSIIVEETPQGGIFNAKAFVNEAFEIARYGRSMDAFICVRGNARRRFARRFSGLHGVRAIQLRGGVVLWSGAIDAAKRPHHGRPDDPGSALMAFVAGAMGQFADLYSQMLKAVGATQRLRELLQEQPEFSVTSPRGAAPASIYVEPLRGEVEFCDVHFRYASRPEVEVLKGILSTSSAVKKLRWSAPAARANQPSFPCCCAFTIRSSGKILMDGRPAAGYPLAWLRNQMSIVPQEALLFGGTIYENIAYGRPGATEAEIMAAARQAHAHEFIAPFPEGYQTLVGERGVKLSGGQRQRVAIARAILKDPAILILDEATSSPDSESERLVQLALDKLMENRTTFMIAHRLATVRRADRILVIQDGKLVESGTHAELNQQDNGLYRRLAELQFNIANDH